MKITPSLLVAFACQMTSYASPHRYSRPSSPFVMPNNSKESILLKLRGGDLGPISSKALAKTFGILAAGDALAGTIKPTSVYEKLGIDNIKPGSLEEHYLGHGVAVSAASLAITSLLALTGKTSIHEAIGYGFLARCAFITEMLLTNKYKKIGVPTAPHVVIFLILLGTAFGLLNGNSASNTMGKVLSILLASHGGLMVLNPRITEDEWTKKIVKVDGGYMFCSSFFAALLAFDVDPVTAMGYTAIFFAPCFVNALDLFTVDTLFGVNVQMWAFGIIVFCGICAYGMLTPMMIT